MQGLGWLIWLFGLLALAVAFFFWRRNRESGSTPTIQDTRREPVIDPMVEEPAPEAEPEGLTDPEPEPPEEMIITLRLMCRDPEGFAAEGLILALREQGLRHGKYGIFHAFDEEEEIVFSVANLVEPGTFDLARIQTQRYPGISLFLVMPGPADPLDAFDSMISLGKSLALQFSADLLDEQGGILSVPRERYLREQIILSQRLQK
ncbi:MAG: cell division protein ZipA C-terminal FtsZ-binding domain-containing protein [Chromatiales bacterium]|nr:cell division protein ZipA C-terminal FtsZ-binding domain-containing protein [Chromatiales bacterium]